MPSRHEPHRYDRRGQDTSREYTHICIDMSHVSYREDMSHVSYREDMSHVSYRKDTSHVSYRINTSHVSYRINTSHVSYRAHQDHGQETSNQSTVATVTMRNNSGDSRDYKQVAHEYKQSTALCRRCRQSWQAQPA